MYGSEIMKKVVLITTGLLTAGLVFIVLYRRNLICFFK